jgi:hypothetical protein
MPPAIVVSTGETTSTVYVAAVAVCRTCQRHFGALSRRPKPATPPDEATVSAAFASLVAELGGVADHRMQCSYCVSAGGQRDMRSWELRTVPEHLPPARGGWLDWDGEEAEEGAP